VYARINNFGEAEKCYFESIALASHVPIAFDNLIQLYLDNHKLSKAKSWIEKARQSFPDDYDLLIQEGKYYFLAEEYDDASESLKRAININPKKVLPYAFLNSIYAEIYSKYDMAIAITKEGLKYDQKSKLLLNSLAYTYLLNDNVKEAREILTKVDEHDDVYLTATKGLLLIKEGKVNDGEIYYNRAATLARGSRGFYNQVHQKKFLELGKYYMRANDMRTALKYFKKAVGLKTPDMIYKNQAVQLYARLKSELQG
jgi:tetratricopeptide (TPR) repeat protein